MPSWTESSGHDPSLAKTVGAFTPSGDVALPPNAAGANATAAIRDRIRIHRIRLFL